MELAGTRPIAVMILDILIQPYHLLDDCHIIMVCEIEVYYYGYVERIEYGTCVYCSPHVRTTERPCGSVGEVLVLVLALVGSSRALVPFFTMLLTR